MDSSYRRIDQKKADTKAWTRKYGFIYRKFKNGQNCSGVRIQEVHS